MSARDELRRRAWEIQRIECPTCRAMALTSLSSGRPPALYPSPAEQVVIDRFGIFAEEES